MSAKREFTVVGKAIPVKDAKEKVCGTLKYPVDFALPGMVFGKIVRSTQPHARILRIDASRAEALPGYLGMVTHEDAPDLDWHGVWLNYIGHIFDGTARFVGDEIAAVAATTSEVAEQAAELVAVEYEPLPAVFDPDEALLPDAPQVQAAGNAREPNVYEWGDLEEGKRAADFTVSADVRFGSQQMAPIGRNAAIAEWNGDKVTLYTGSQSPSELRDGLAQAFGIPQSKTRVVALPLGASFGEFWSNNFMMIAPLLAKKVRRPVKIELTNEECMAFVKRRHKEHCRASMGCTGDGEITFIDVYHIMDNGGYGFKVEVGYFNIDNWGARARSGRYECQGVSTNLVTGGCMRGVGDVTMGSIVERLADRLAEKAGMDPVEFRIRNQIKPGDPLRQTWAKTLMRHDEEGYRKVIEESAREAPAELRENWPKLFHLSSGCSEPILRKGAEAFGWKDKFVGWGKPYAFDGPKRRAVGVGTGIHLCGEEMEGNTDAVVRLMKDGSAKVCCSIGRHGTCADTTQAQIAAETLGIAVERIEVETGDTDSCPWSRGSLASTTLFRTGFKVWAACLDAKRQLLELAAREFFDNDPSRLEVRDGYIYYVDKSGPYAGRCTMCSTGVSSISIPDVMMHFRSDALGPTDSITGRPAFPMPPSTAFSRHFAAQFADVEVDVETGEIRLLDYLVAQDSGTIINPKVFEGQIIGGATLGAGFALCETLHFDESGRILNPNLTDYKVLRMTDFPAWTRTLWEEDYDPVGPFGARSAGEAPIAAAPAALSQAVYNATGVWVNPPMTPEHVLDALREHDNVEERRPQVTAPVPAR
jgi:xanthine dehydrogenase molybdenum-binding subunit